MIHNANHLRPKVDGLKVGGHQASSASVVTLMTALYFDVLRPSDRVAVKPHASPVFHAIQYLCGRQTREKLEKFRAYGGAQSYPSRTKDADDVDFSTGSVGLGVAMTTFASLVQDYVRLKGLPTSHAQPPGRMIALLGDAEFDEGNVFEAMLEGWKHDIRNVWWIVDYNRQSLDSVVADRLFHRMDSIFRDMEWNVVTLKYGRLLQNAFGRRGGEALRDWIDDCPNAQYSALVNRGGRAWREALKTDLGDTSGIKELLDEHDDESLQRLMSNLAGHDLAVVRDAFNSVKDDRPTCFLAYTIKGHGLPFAAHKDNHSGLMSSEQIDVLRRQMNIRSGEEWERFAGLDIDDEDLSRFLATVPFVQEGERRWSAPRVSVPARFEVPPGENLSTQEAFGRLLLSIARDHSSLADHIVTTSPDVTVSTNLGGWVNRRGIFDRIERGDVFSEAQVVSPQKWAVSPKGQHIELGIAESNLFILLAALGLSEPLFGSRILPIGTVYDPFIARGLDALNYACYQDARFILAATPSGLSLAPEGGAHQSVFTPLIGIGQPSLTAFEPAYADELCVMLRWSLEHLQDDHGGAVYLRLSTRHVKQSQRTLTPDLEQQIVDGGYWLKPPGAASEIALVASGAILPEVLEVYNQIEEDIPDAGILVVTSADRLHHDWIEAQRNKEYGSSDGSHIERLLAQISARAGLVTILDGHPATLSWLGAVRGQTIVPLGVERFGQSGSIPELYHAYGLDVDAILDAVARLSLQLLEKYR
ncbi:MAG: 1-deoxy-D-xylulose-5-phosphate synthase N-terminal domain-containing protein [Vicinamibacterales bacterium]